MSPVGDILRGERLRRGLKPSEVAAEIKITTYLVEAMEAGRFDRLPGGSYRRSFLRQYAHILGMDENEIVAAFREQFADPEVDLPTPPAEHHEKPWGLVWMVLAVVACIGADRVLQDDRPAVPQRILASTPVQQAGVAPSIAAPVVPPRQADEPRPALDAARSTLDAARPVRVAFTPSEPVWISVKCDGSEAFSGTLDGSATREFGASTKMVILIGNAGGLAVSWNGRPIGPIGAHGEIQLLEVTAQGARVVPRKRAPPPTPQDGPGAY
jgi:transcriptional regulator with XRE-family HTH domain